VVNAGGRWPRRSACLFAGAKGRCGIARDLLRQLDEL
jgi:hypothetical protein